MIIRKEDSYKIVGAAMEVYNQLGHGFLEAVYQEALEREFRSRGIPYEREKELIISYKGEPLEQTYKADFICYEDIIVELKAVSMLQDSHRSQVYNYLRATKNKLGLLINFGNSDTLEWERKVL
jgi:GxxExxY protein